MSYSRPCTKGYGDLKESALNIRTKIFTLVTKNLSLPMLIESNFIDMQNKSKNRYEILLFDFDKQNVC